MWKTKWIECNKCVHIYRLPARAYLMNFQLRMYEFAHFAIVHDITQAQRAAPNWSLLED